MEITNTKSNVYNKEHFNNCTVHLLLVRKARSEKITVGLQDERHMPENPAK